MKLSKVHKAQIKSELEKYILGGFLERDQQTPILVGSTVGEFFTENGDYFDQLKEWVELISGKKTDWVAGINGNQTYMGLCFIKNVEHTKHKDFYLSKELRFVIELKAFPIKKSGSK